MDTHRVLQDAVRWGMVARNVCHAVKSPPDSDPASTAGGSDTSRAGDAEPSNGSGWSDHKREAMAAAGLGLIVGTGVLAALIGTDSFFIIPVAATFVPAGFTLLLAAAGGLLRDIQSEPRRIVASHPVRASLTVAGALLASGIAVAAILYWGRDPPTAMLLCGGKIEAGAAFSLDGIPQHTSDERLAEAEVALEDDQGCARFPIDDDTLFEAICAQMAGTPCADPKCEVDGKNLCVQKCVALAFLDPDYNPTSGVVRLILEAESGNTPYCERSIVLPLNYTETEHGMTFTGIRADK